MSEETNKLREAPETGSMPGKNESTMAARYEEAKRAMAAAQTRLDYQEAEEAFRVLGAWRDAEVLAEQCREKADVCRKDGTYSTGLWQMRRKSISGYLSAIQLFESIPGWKDADAKAADCRKSLEQVRERQARTEKNAMLFKKILKWAGVCLVILALLGVAFAQVWKREIIPRRRYREAVALMEQGEYLAARNLLEALDPEKSAERLASIRDTLLRRADVGSLIVYGDYEQDGDEKDGLEGILWRVLERDGDRFFLLSESGIDVHAYEKPGRNITWADCQLRAWLNGEFLNTAFTPEEQAHILTTHVTADQNPSFDRNSGGDTEDKLYQLSIPEAYRYFSTDEERRCTPTVYAQSLGGYASKDLGTTWWWLRTPGIVTNYAAYVLADGSIRESGFYVSYAYTAVRPAMWLDLSEWKD